MSEPSKVLIVDDDEVVRLSYQRSLQAANCNVDVEAALNGEEALEALESKRFDVVLLDLRMPGMDGMSVLKSIKRDWPASGVVVITGYPTVESAKEAMRLGAYRLSRQAGEPGRDHQRRQQRDHPEKVGAAPGHPDATPIPDREQIEARLTRKRRIHEPLRKVLVVDDDPVISKSFNRVLAGKGYMVVSAENGQEALNKVASEQYDAVFTDIRMPGMDGIEVAEQMRAKQPVDPGGDHHRLWLAGK